MDKDFIIKEDSTQLFIDGKEVQPIGEYEMNFAKEADKFKQDFAKLQDKIYFSKLPTDKLMELRDAIIEEVNRRNS